MLEITFSFACVQRMRGSGPLFRNKVSSSYCSYQRFDIQTRRKGKFFFVLILSPRSHAFLNKGREYLNADSTAITAIGVLVSVVGGKPENLDKKRAEQAAQRQTQLTFDTRSRIRTWTTLMKGERSHHCAIHALQDTLVRTVRVQNVLGTKRFQTP